MNELKAFGSQTTATSSRSFTRLMHGIALPRRRKKSKKLRSKPQRAKTRKKSLKTKKRKKSLFRTMLDRSRNKVSH